MHTNKAIMSLQNNMAKESYTYKIILSGYAENRTHKIFKLIICINQYTFSSYLLQDQVSRSKEVMPKFTTPLHCTEDAW